MKKINEDFECIACWKMISKADKTCRNHCPYCFISLHVDGKTPGDRASSCGWKMYPVAYEQRNGGFRILFFCSNCSKQHRNKRADDDEVTLLPNLITQYRSIHLWEI